MDKSTATKIKSALRKVSMYHPARKEALDRNKTPYSSYKCDACAYTFPKELIFVDHIHPVVKTEGPTDWNAYIERLFCPSYMLQILCRDCHYDKTQAENHRRRKHKARA